MSGLVATQISTPRLTLVPLSKPTARAVVAGDLSGVRHAAGWPHDDTLDALRMALAAGSRSLVWLVAREGVVIGDCGTVGSVDPSGDIELGYGLAAECRGLGYGNEVVAALSDWLIRAPGVRRVVARDVVAANVPSRRALERAGFVLEREEAGLTWYALERRSRPGRM
jgi:RimJ/RimL family protein N-acetyltransferase